MRPQPAVPTVPPSTVARHEHDALVGSDRDGTPPDRGALRHVPAVALVLVVAGAFAVFLAFPTYPAYDSLYSLLWAEEVLGGQLPGFDAYRAPTEHPLLLPVGLVLAPFGDAGRAGVRRALPGRDGGAAGRDVPARASSSPACPAGSSPPACC